MITKFSKYNLIKENSLFYNDLKEFMPGVHKELFNYLIDNNYFRVKDFKLKEYSRNEYSNKELIDIILDEHKNTLIAVNILYNNLYVIFKNVNGIIRHEKIGSDYNYSTSLVLNQIDSKNVRYFEIETENIDRKKEFKEVYELYIENYDKYIIRISNELFHNIKKILIEHLSKLDKYHKIKYDNKEDLDYNYSQELQEDLVTLSEYKKHNLTFATFEKELNEIYKEMNFKSVNKFISYVNLNTNLICKKVMLIQYMNLINDLKFKRYQHWDKELTSDVSLWNAIKNKINDKKLLDKYKHLDNANNFDIL